MLLLSTKLGMEFACETLKEVEFKFSFYCVRPPRSTVAYCGLRFWNFKYK